ncbi:MAG: UbiX family flavin prenyltransferase [Enterocloster asparagiformis]|nr:UbiX family flavin prenyltransferase [Enterocloster asparagiformis]
MCQKRLIVGVSGASGAPIALELLRALRPTEIESHLIITSGGERTIEYETGLTVREFARLADRVYDNENIGAAVASGSYRTMGMAIAPCSMKTLAGINSGYSSNLLLRAADVTLKERRPLVLAARECPLSAIHLRNMYELTQMGAVILPPVLSFYNHPESLQDAMYHIVGKILDQFDIPFDRFTRWQG